MEAAGAGKVFACPRPGPARPVQHKESSIETKAPKQSKSIFH